LAWYETNKANLNYDTQTQRFVLGANGSQTPQPLPPLLSGASPAGLSVGSTNPVNSVQSTNQPQPIVMPTIYMMRELGRQAASGDTSAIDKIELIRQSIYQNCSYKDNPRGWMENAVLMRAALDQTALSIKGDDPNDPAFKSLLYAATMPGIRGFIADSFGTAAAQGNKPSLDVLLHYSEHGFLLSSAVGGLCKPAQNGNPEAVAFLIKVADDESSKALWYMSTSALENAANEGNPDAQRVRAKYADYEKQRRHPGKSFPQPSPGVLPASAPSTAPTPSASPGSAATPIQPIPPTNAVGAASASPSKGDAK